MPSFEDFTLICAVHECSEKARQRGASVAVHNTPFLKVQKKVRSENIHSDENHDSDSKFPRKARDTTRHIARRPRGGRVARSRSRPRVYTRVIHMLYMHGRYSLTPCHAHAHVHADAHKHIVTVPRARARAANYRVTDLFAPTARCLSHALKLCVDRRSARNVF